MTWKDEEPYFEPWRDDHAALVENFTRLRHEAVEVERRWSRGSLWLFGGGLAVVAGIVLVALLAYPWRISGIVMALVGEVAALHGYDLLWPADRRPTCRK